MSKKKNPHLLERLLDQEKHRLHVALATEEGEWNQHEPNSGMARIFVVMLLLHVILIAGIVIYDIMDEEVPVPPPSLAVTPSAPNDAEREATLQSEPVEKTTEPETPAEPAINPADYEMYTVKSGDTLPGIAKALNVDQDALVKLNKLDQGASFDAQSKLLIPNEKLPAPGADTASEVPAAKPVDRRLFEPNSSMAAAKDAPPAPATKPEAAVAPAESSEPVAPANDDAPKAIPMPELTQSKEVAPPPPEKQVEPAPEPRTPPAPAVTKTHTLESGETLYRLSIIYGVSVDALQKANNITDPGKLQIGQKLVIPAK